jgi:hypothetical protein
MAQTPIILRRSPFVMLRQIIILEIAIGFLLLIPTLFERIELLTTTDAHALHSNIVGIIGLAALQILLITLVFIRWYLTVYTIKGSKIVIVQNFISRKEENYKLDNIASITLTQNLFDKIFKTARLTAKDSEGHELFVLKNIADPAYNLSLIENIQEKKNTKKTTKSKNKPINLKDLIKNGENQNVEFKSTLLWDNKSKSPNKEIQHSIMKTITGFMNTQGGLLIIGVDDKKNIIGLQDDLKNMKRKDLDGFENFFNMIFTNMIGLEFRKYIEISFKKLKKKDICIIKVKPSSKPVYLKDKKNESFYIRAGNATHPLRISEANRYIDENFKKANTA